MYLGLVEDYLYYVFVCYSIVVVVSIMVVVGLQSVISCHQVHASSSAGLFSMIGYVELAHNPQAAFVPIRQLTTHTIM